MGFNGLPRGVPDDVELLRERDRKLAVIIHAEVNALLFARRDVTGHTLYTWPLPPCSNCAALIVQSGVTRVVSPRDGDALTMSRWEESVAASQKLFKDRVSFDLV